MPEIINLPMIMAMGLVAMASPGPATLTISAISMSSGKYHGLAVASGVTTGSLIWSISAALGLGTLMLANAWAFEIIRYLGVLYLLFLAYKSAKSAFSQHDLTNNEINTGSIRKAYTKGLLLHLTNPKAILFFGSLFSIGVPSDATYFSLFLIVGVLGVQSFLIFHGYALFFSSPGMRNLYSRLRRWIEGLVAICFAGAGIKVLVTKIE